MKKIVKKIISMVLSTTCILTMTAFPAFAAETSSPADRLETGLSQLEEKYDVTIKKAPTARKASALSLEEVNSTLTDLESSLIKGQQARIENHQAYEQYMKELEESGRMDTSDSSTTPDSPAPRALISRIYYHSIGTLVPNGTSIRCSMTGNTTSDAYGNTVWASLSSHSSRLNSGYGTDWTETDFSYDLIDGRRTYVCHFIGTLEEPYKQSGFIGYYVYSEGWDIWFEAYST